MNDIFFSKQHEEAFKELLLQADIVEEKCMGLTELECRQKAFFYIIALYQESYERYEGCRFYVENLGELSLDGPVYLLESNQFDYDKKEHEIMLKIGMELLQGKVPTESLPDHLQSVVNHAIKWMDIA